MTAVLHPTDRALPSATADPLAGLVRPREPQSYDGHSPFPDQFVPESPGVAATRLVVTVSLVLIPFLGLIAVGWMAWGRMLTMSDVALASFFYVLTGLGVTVGFHRGLTHRSFRMRRPLRIASAIAGSMAFQGAVIDWVATHRRHHAFTDRPGDPHSPYRYGTSPWGQVRGLVHAHMGWFLVNDPTSAKKFAPDLLDDSAMRRVHRAFPLLCAVSLLLPFAAGCLLTSSLRGGATALLWAGLARVCLLQHVTWSVNSLCHVMGDRPYATRRFDRATDLWPLALLSFGESWHNGHHADPTCARHGRGKRQLDPSAFVIHGCERLGLITDVKWPDQPPKPRVGLPAQAVQQGRGLDGSRQRPHRLREASARRPAGFVRDP